MSFEFHISLKRAFGSSHKAENIVSTALIIMILILMVPDMAISRAENTKGPIRVPDDQTTQILTLADGSKIIGRITSISQDSIKFNSDLGEISVDLAKIKDIKEVPSSSIKEGRYWFENPNYSRLYFAPTGRMLKKGRAYFSDYYLFFPGIAVGFTDNITLGGGMSLFPGVDLENQVFYFTPKIGIVDREKSSLAVGALIIALPEIDDERHTAGIIYGVGTYGGYDASLTAGLGYGFVDGHIADKPMVVIGGEKRLSRRISFVSENWIFPGVNEPLISYGLRFFGEGISVDLALFNLLGDDAIFPGVPWVDFVFNF